MGVTSTFEIIAEKLFIKSTFIFATIPPFITLKSLDIKKIIAHWYNKYIIYFHLNGILLLFSNTFLVANINTKVTPTQELIVLFNIRLADTTPSRVYVQKSNTQPIPLKPTNLITCLNKLFTPNHFPTLFCVYPTKGLNRIFSI